MEKKRITCEVKSNKPGNSREWTAMHEEEKNWRKSWRNLASAENGYDPGTPVVLQSSLPFLYLLKNTSQSLMLMMTIMLIEMIMKSMKWMMMM